MTDSRTGKVTGAADSGGGAEVRAAARDRRPAAGGTGPGRPAAEADRVEPQMTDSATGGPVEDGSGPADAVPADAVPADAVPADAVPADVEPASAEVAAATVTETAVTETAVTETAVTETAVSGADAAGADPAPAVSAEVEVVAAEVAIGDEGAAAVDETAPVDGEVAVVPLGAELAALRTELDERTKDLQRITAEYANYRKRVERDKGLVADQAIGTVLAALLPVLDDLDRAREHGDLVGPFGAVAEQLTAALGKYALTSFGEKGDVFDPTRHEAVAHEKSAEVTEPTCVDVMRRGYLFGDRLLRPALVAVADPE